MKSCGSAFPSLRWIERISAWYQAHSLEFDLRTAAIRYTLLGFIARKSAVRRPSSRENLPWLSAFPFLPKSIHFNFRFALLSGVLLSLFPLALSAQSLSFTGGNTAVNFGTVNLCAAGKTSPAPCSATMTLTYKVTASGTLRAIQVLAGRNAPSSEFKADAGSTCAGNVTAGSSCTIKATFTPQFAGARTGAVLIASESGAVLATTPLVGAGVGAQFRISNSGQTESFVGNSMGDGGAVDGAGNVFVIDYVEDPGISEVLEYPAGGGPAITLYSAPYEFSGPVAVDSAGDVFFISPIYPSGDMTYYEVLELPAAGGAVRTLPFADSSVSNSLVGPYGLQVDGAGDVFVFDSYDPNDNAVKVLEIPFGCQSSACQITVRSLPSPTLGHGIITGTVDTAGDLFYLYYTGTSDDDEVLTEVPAGGAEITLASGSALNPLSGLGVDGVGNLYSLSVGADNNYEENFSNVWELYAGSHTLVTIASDVIGGYPLTVDSTGDLIMNGGYPGTAILPRTGIAPLNFGTVLPGSSATQPLQVLNTGNRPLTVTAAFTNSSYKIASESPGGCPVSITASEPCTLGVEFSPAKTGVYDNLSIFDTNGAVNPSVSLTGTAGVVAAPTFSPAAGVYASAQSVVIDDATAGATIHYTTDGSLPTASSPTYPGAIFLRSTQTLTAIAVASGYANSAPATAPYTIATNSPADVINFGGGFATDQSTINFEGDGYLTTAQSLLRFNGNAALDGPRLQLTGLGTFEAGSAYYATPVNVEAFTTYFTFQLTDPNADGFTFTMQGDGPEALGSYGGGLGYATIPNSVAVKFDLHNNAGEGPSSTALYTEGTMPTAPAINLNGTGIDLHSGDAMLAEFTYNETNLVLTLTDTVTLATWSHTFASNIPLTVGNTAYIGFTGGTGSETADQEILSWTYVSGEPGASPPAPAVR